MIMPECRALHRRRLPCYNNAWLCSFNELCTAVLDVSVLDHDAVVTLCDITILISECPPESYAFPVCRFYAEFLAIIRVFNEYSLPCFEFFKDCHGILPLLVGPDPS